MVNKSPPDLSFETACGVTPVCGVDEVGRGPLAGPVLACAVILPDGWIPPGVGDSKKLTARRREALFEVIMDRAQVGMGQASVAEIDEINILHASLRAMRRAIRGLPLPPAHALIDGNRLPPDLPCPGTAVVKGDARSASIAAASIVAKVTRDRIMVSLAQQYPNYGWERNAGYGVKTHMEALKTYGVTPHHRRSFAPVHNMLWKLNP